MGNRFAKAAGGFVPGRETYEIFAAVGSSSPTFGHHAAKLNHHPKYVASTTILDGDVVEAVAELKGEDGDEFQIHGSGHLAQTLMGHNLIDIYELLVFPIVLGEGKRLFESAVDHSMRLAGSATADSGLVVLADEPAGELTSGSVDDPRSS